MKAWHVVHVHIDDELNVDHINVQEVDNKDLVVEAPIIDPPLSSISLLTFFNAIVQKINE
jgi:hypothetical protein